MKQSVLKQFPAKSLALSTGKSLLFYFGDLSLCVSHHNYEWRTEYSYCKPVVGSAIGQYGKLIMERYAINAPGARISLAPRLADRAIVSRPLAPITLLPNSETTVYVGTPLWLDLKIDDILIKELSCVILSDTWFGRDTLQGELCYSTSTRARLDAKQLVRDSHKAITPIVISNQGIKSITLERINVPVPFLSLYQEKDGQFTTSTLAIVLEHNVIDAKLEIKPPLQADSLKKVADSSKPIKKAFVYRTLDLLFA